MPDYIEKKKERKTENKTMSTIDDKMKYYQFCPQPFQS